MKIKAHIRLENGRLISKANATRFVVRGKKDISKTVLGFNFTPSYREQWVIVHEPEGYIWREVTHALGINGHWPTIRDLVRGTAAQGYEIEVLAEPIPDAVFASVKSLVERRHA
jgi:hypothetical protein